MGRHSKPSKRMSSSKTVVLCLIGVAVSGTGAFYGVNNITKGNFANAIRADITYELPTSALLPTTSPPAPVVLRPGAEKDEPPISGPPLDTPSPLPTPLRPSQRATQPPVTQDPLPPTQPPQPQGQERPAPRSELPAEDENDSEITTSSTPPPVQSKCVPQAGIGLRNVSALATADIVSKFKFSGILGGRGGRSIVSDHPLGLATDFITNNNVRLGDSIRDYALANQARLNVKYVIYRQRFYASPGPGTLMEDRGSITQNHFDHVHISFNAVVNPDFDPRCN